MNDLINKEPCLARGAIKGYIKRMRTAHKEGRLSAKDLSHNIKWVNSRYGSKFK